MSPPTAATVPAILGRHRSLPIGAATTRLGDRVPMYRGAMARS